jgi:hypothetical protein
MKMFPFKTKFRLIKGPFKTGFTILAAAAAAAATAAAVVIV